MAAPESKLSPSRTQGLARSVQAETIRIQHSVVSIQSLIRLRSVGIRLRRRAANLGGVL